jgi:hypothetical protein
MTGTGFFGFGPKQDGGSIGVGNVVAGADVTVTQALIDKTTGFAGVYIGNNTTPSTGIVTFDGTVSFPGRLSVQMAGTGGSVLLTSNAAVTVGATDLSDVFETRLLAGPGGTVTMNAGSSLTTGADVRIQSDDFTALGGTRSGDRLSLGRSSDGGTVYVGSGLSGAVAATSLSATDIDGLQVGFNRLAVGTAGSTGPAVRVGTLTLPAKPLELHGASIAIEQQITGPGRSLTLGAAGTIAIVAPVGGTTDRLSGISVVTATDVRHHRRRHHHEPGDRRLHRRCARRNEPDRDLGRRHRHLRPVAAHLPPLLHRRAHRERRAAGVGRRRRWWRRRWWRWRRWRRGR